MRRIKSNGKSRVGSNLGSSNWVPGRQEIGTIPISQEVGQAWMWMGPRVALGPWFRYPGSSVSNTKERKHRGEYQADLKTHCRERTNLKGTRNKSMRNGFQ